MLFTSNVLFRIKGHWKWLYIIIYTWAKYMGCMNLYDSHDERCWLLSLLPYFLWRPKRLPSAPMHWSWRQQGRASKWNFSATSLRNCSIMRSKSNRKKNVTAASRDVIPVMYSLRFLVFYTNLNMTWRTPVGWILVEATLVDMVKMSMISVSQTMVHGHQSISTDL